MAESDTGVHSVRIMAFCPVLAGVCRECGEALPAHLDHAVFDLEGAAIEQWRRVRDQGRLTLETLRGDHNIEDPGFVFHRQKKEDPGFVFAPGSHNARTAPWSTPERLTKPPMSTKGLSRSASRASRAPRGRVRARGGGRA